MQRPLNASRIFITILDCPHDSTVSQRQAIQPRIQALVRQEKKTKNNEFQNKERV